MPETPLGRHHTRHLRPGVTHVMVVYCSHHGVRRRVIDADHQWEYAHHIANLHPGERYHMFTHAEYDAHDCPHKLNETVAKIAGFEKHPGVQADRHAVVHPEGHTVGYIHACVGCGDQGEHIAPGHMLRHEPK